MRKPENEGVAAVSALNGPGSGTPSAGGARFRVLLRQGRLVFHVRDLDGKRLTTVDAIVFSLHGTREVVVQWPNVCDLPP